MANGVEYIGKKDVAWSYAATILMVGAGVILLPFMLNKLPQQTIGIWNIFQVITALVTLLDFGFQPSFARNISYVFSGVKALQKEGVAVAPTGEETDYGLLKTTLRAMQVFYRRMALTVFLLLLTAGTAYLYYVLRAYEGDRTEVLTAWVLLIAINSVNLYTFYYDALLTGKGYVKRAQQINIVGQACYLILGIGLLYAGFGLVAVVLSQLASIVTKRILMYRTFYTPELKAALAAADESDYGEVLRTIMPNAVKMGLTSLGGWLVYKSAVLLGSAMLPLALMASYGITLQLVDILIRCGSVVYLSFVPKISQYRVERNYPEMRRIYRLSIGSMWLIVLAGGVGMLYLGNPVLTLLKSQTMLLPAGPMALLLAVHVLERNHVISWGFLLADNRVPFFVPSLIAGGVTVVLTWLMVGPLQWGVWGLIAAPGLAQLVYQNWKWPYVVIKELFVTHA